MLRIWVGPCGAGRCAGAGVGRRRGAGSWVGAAPGLRCHDHDRALGEGVRGADVEAHVRVPPAAVLPGPPRGRRRGGVGRDPAARATPGSNTAADHITVLDLALAQLPAGVAPDPGRRRAGRGCWPGRTPPGRPTRSPTRASRGGSSSRSGSRSTPGSAGSWTLIPDDCWDPAIQTDDDLRDGAWVFEVTGLVDLRAWPAGSRLILRKERPHPGAQLTFTDLDGHRITAVLTNTPPGSSPGRPLAWSCATASTPASRTGSGRPRPPACATCPATTPP